MIPTEQLLDIVVLFREVVIVDDAPVADLFILRCLNGGLSSEFPCASEGNKDVADIEDIEGTGDVADVIDVDSVGWLCIADERRLLMFVLFCIDSSMCPSATLLDFHPP